MSREASPRDHQAAFDMFTGASQMRKTERKNIWWCLMMRVRKNLSVSVYNNSNNNGGGGGCGGGQEIASLMNSIQVSRGAP